MRRCDRDRAALGHRAVQLGITFATLAAFSLESARLQRVAQQRVAQLQRSLEDRSVIYQAIGVVQGRIGRSDQDALAHLRQISKRANLELAAIAQRVVRQAARRAQNRANPS